MAELRLENTLHVVIMLFCLPLAVPATLRYKDWRVRSEETSKSGDSLCSHRSGLRIHALWFIYNMHTVYIRVLQWYTLYMFLIAQKLSDIFTYIQLCPDASNNGWTAADSSPQELAKKLQKRQSELQELEATGTHAKAPADFWVDACGNTFSWKKHKFNQFQAVKSMHGRWCLFSHPTFFSGRACKLCTHTALLILFVYRCLTALRSPFVFLPGSTWQCCVQKWKETSWKCSKI